jgi:hypothetical protein
MAETTAAKQRRGAGRPFEPGTSGNPAGRPKGVRHRVTMLAEQLLDGDAEKIVRKTITLGLDGDVTALRLLLDRILPPRRDRPVAFSLPALTAPRDAATALAAVVDAVAAGNLTPQRGWRPFGANWPFCQGNRDGRIGATRRET